MYLLINEVEFKLSTYDKNKHKFIRIMQADYPCNVIYSMSNNNKIIKIHRPSTFLFSRYFFFLA